MRIEIIKGDATTVEADVLVLKHAQAYYGLDAYVAQRLSDAGHTEHATSPKPGAYSLVPSTPGVAARNILFVGVNPLWEFEYRQIRKFACDALSFLAEKLPDARRVAVTIHGAGYGLDEDEAFKSQLAGFLDAIRTSAAPRQLEVITFVERNGGRATRLRNTLEQLMHSGKPHATLDRLGFDANERLGDAGYASASKRHVFVAMPFCNSMNDVYDYGIRNAVKKAGLLCERADMSAYTGDIVTWVRDRIRTASLVIADLSGANPNVYLEVGFAWGCGVPTVLLARDSNELLFDVRGQRCLIYGRIRDLEEKLEVELKNLAQR